MNDTPSGETVSTEAPSNNANPTATPSVQTPQVNAVDTAEVERLRKEKEQAIMRANQLENELRKKAEEEQEAQRKALEEQNEWKTIAEQEKAKREEMEENQRRAERKAELDKGTQEIFSEFSQEVIEIAKETGLSLTDTDESAKQALKSKLESISAKIGNKGGVAPNNPAPSSDSVSTAELLGEAQLGETAQRREAAAAELFKSHPAIKEMKRMAGFQEQ